MSLMCLTLRVSRSGFYRWLYRDESARAQDDRRLTLLIRKMFDDSRGTYGSPRIHAALKAMGERVGHKRVERLMRKAGVFVRAKRKFRRTTDSRHNKRVAPNILDQDFSVDAPNKVWVSDITYVWTDEGWLYLASTLDLFSRKVVGWSMSTNLASTLVEDALKMAFGLRSPPAGLIHHSDRGIQYAADSFQALLKKHGAVCSMSGKGNCFDNAVKESFFHTLKTELCYRRRYKTRAEARASIFEFIEAFYNRSRIHSTLKYLSPLEFEAKHVAG